ncbi:hypothetical protein GEMRC1_011581 [Eukaryota sp. GEM-RC1]
MVLKEEVDNQTTDNQTLLIEFDHLNSEILNLTTKLNSSNDKLTELESQNSTLFAQFSESSSALESLKAQVSHVMASIKSDLSHSCFESLFPDQDLSTDLATLAPLFSTLQLEFVRLIKVENEFLSMDLQSILKSFCDEHRLLTVDSIQYKSLEEQCVNLKKKRATQRKLIFKLSEQNLMTSWELEHFRRAFNDLTVDYDQLKSSLPVLILKYSNIISQNLSKTRTELFEVKSAFEFYKTLSFDLEQKLSASVLHSTSNLISSSKHFSDSETTLLRQNFDVVTRKLSDSYATNATLRNQISNLMGELQALQTLVNLSQSNFNDGLTSL